MSHPGLNEREIERVLAGHQPHGRDDLAEVAYFFARLRTLGDFEQPPPMSPKLLAELDASDVARREDELARERARRNRAMRRRWQLVGAAAVVTMLGGLFVLAARNPDGREPAVDVESPNTSGPVDQPAPSSSVPGTQAPETTTTAPPVTTAPPATEPPETTAPPPPPTDQDDTTILQGPGPYPGPGSGYPPGPYGGGNGDDWDWEEDLWRQFREYCEDHPYDETCRYWDQDFDRYGDSPPP